MYLRPELPSLEFRDAQGDPIPYGNRWDQGAPPDSTYSLTRHPERFEPLIGVARALVAFLERTYAVDVVTVEGLPEDAPEPLRRYEHGQVRVVRTTTLTPRHELCAPLVIAETTFPTVVVVAGAGGLERAPQCGCDACDEDIEACAEELEQLVFAVANGRYQEVYSWAEGIQRSYAGDWGGRSSTTPRHAASKEEIEAVRVSQRERHGERWLPWPPRHDGEAGGAPRVEQDPDDADTPFGIALERIKRHLRTA